MDVGKQLLYGVISVGRTGTAVVCLCLLGCRDFAAPPASSAASNAGRSTIAQNNFKVRSDEQAFADLAVSVPSSAGMFREPDGTIVVQVVDPADDRRAAPAFDRLAQKDVILRHHGRRVRVRRAQFTFYTLAYLRDQLFDHVLGTVPGVVSLDLDEVRNRVTVGIDEAVGGVARAPTIISEILRQGIDTAGIMLVSTSTDKRQSAPSLALMSYGASLLDAWDPVVAGLFFVSARSVDNGGNPGGCTIGFVADRNSTRGFVSASHCTDTMYGTDTVSTFQRGGHYLASETVDPSGTTCSGHPCRGSDASFFTIGYAATGVASTIGLIAKPATIGDTTVYSWDPVYEITTVNSSFLISGTPVNLVGYISGLQTGIVQNTCVDRTSATGFTTTCLVEATYSANIGDSGGPIFVNIEEPNHVALVGVHKGTNGTYTNFSSIGSVFSDLGGTIVAHHAVSLGTPTLSGSVSSPYPVVSWTAVSGATTYYIYREWADYQLNTSSNGLEFVGSTGNTSFLDTGIHASSYNRSTVPAVHTRGYISYYVYAVSGLDWGNHSANKYWIYAP